MKLKTINNILRRLGILLVVTVDWESRCQGTKPSPTIIEIMTQDRFQRQDKEYEDYWALYGPRPSERLQLLEKEQE